MCNKCKVYVQFKCTMYVQQMYSVFTINIHCIVYIHMNANHKCGTLQSMCQVQLKGNLILISDIRKIQRNI